MKTRRIIFILCAAVNTYLLFTSSDVGVKALCAIGMLICGHGFDRTYRKSNHHDHRL